MDRLEFSKSIDIDPIIQVKEYFDEIMGMYNLFGDYKNISITKNPNDISFDLLFKTEKEAKEMLNAVNGKSISLYYNDFTIMASDIDKCKITIYFK